MRSRWIPLSLPRIFMRDMLHFAAKVPSVPVQRRMNLSQVAIARLSAGRPSWPALFLKAFANVAQEMPVLRRAYVKLPWAHIVEYPTSVASIAVERDYDGEPAVFFGHISSPAKLSVYQVHAKIRELSEAPIESIKQYRKVLMHSKLPTWLRRFGMSLGLNISRTRAGLFGTFGVSVYSSLGAESLHPISPLTTTLTYGVIPASGEVDVRLVYDHRVLDGATVARVLAKLEEQLNGAVLAELRAVTEMARLAG